MDFDFAGDRSEAVGRMECTLCGVDWEVGLLKYSQKRIYRGEQVCYERWSCRCNACGHVFEPAWVFERNMDSIRLAYENIKRGGVAAL